MSQMENFERDRAGRSTEPPLSGGALPAMPKDPGFEGVIEVQPSKREKLVKMCFVEAAAYAHEKPVVPLKWTDEKAFEVWRDDNFRIVFERFGPDKVAADPDLPPYSAAIMTQPGKSFWMHAEGNGWSSLNEEGGHIVRAGESVYHFYKSYSDAQTSKRPQVTLKIDLDQVNDWSYPERPPVSEESRAMKKSWNRFWHPSSEENSGHFMLEGTPRKKLELKSADDMRKLAGPAELIAIWERDDDAPLEETHYEDRCTFAYDPKSKSYAMLECTPGEGDHRLYIFDGKGRFAGFYRVQDDGSREWLEAFPGELGKPE